MSTVQLTNESFEAVVAQEGVVLVDFWEPGCAPCAAFAPVFERVSQRHPDLCFARVDVEAEPTLAETFGVTAVPTLMVFRDGVPLVREPGVLADADLESLISHVAALDMTVVNRAIAELVRQSSGRTEPQLH